MSSFEQSIARHARNGKILLNIAGTDCDGVSYAHSYVTSAATAEAEIEKIRDFADGTIDVDVGYPR